MSNSVYAISSNRILTPEGLIKGYLVVHEGIIESIHADESAPPELSNYQTGDWVVMPGLIDPHVHINEPGRTHWEGFDTATRAAAAGGITTLVDMPLNSSPVTTSKKAFTEKLKAANASTHVNVAFWGGLVPSSLNELPELLKSGVMGIKVFLCHSGIDDFPQITTKELRAASPYFQASKLPLLVHAELPTKETKSDYPDAGSYAAYLNSRPAQWELDAIEMMINFCEEFRVPVHIVHLATAKALPMIKKAKARSLPITVETCPHYLYFASEDILDGQTQFKCAPPIRNRANNLQLWNALQEGVIDFIATDHSPSPPEMKQLESGDFIKAWGGISSLQFLLPLIWTLGQSHKISLFDLHQWVSLAAARFLNIDDHKGKIVPGYDADLVVWNPEEEFQVTSEIIEFRHKVTPYMNCKLQGVVKRTYIGGHVVYDDGLFLGHPAGSLITR
ncbi:MAG: allantoinase AllB [Cyclobacteriaceae bacterium]|nr:allantoinase AllB [Cyclobacteriaceae bacterium]